ncbi:protein CHROMOSOME TRANSMISSION FIDELITY 7-like [Impatiens glandulifera]|uniref:protein CHROMOSOME TRANSMISSION FIDELITY 7-like n=1 Tax=Impatiens glandulifera TaxID=253017 RepID=UPI001FB0C339|nr:protein CHROMOSOME TRANSMISSION FIDELITY 7-like [Impatiens glandulifera]
MQTKITDFCKAQQSPNETLPQYLSCPIQTEDHRLRSKSEASCQWTESACSSQSSLKSIMSLAKNQKKRRRYDQLHLELGQSDFLLHACSICGFSYVCGDEEDEKVHKEFHKDFMMGIQFKGWKKERVLQVPNKSVRIILVMDGDPPAHTKKVKKVFHMIETELGSTLLIHKLCKTYLYIYNQRIAGCVIVEPIKVSYRILPGISNVVNDKTTKQEQPNSSLLQFGGICFQRESVKKRTYPPKVSEELRDVLMGALVVGEEAIPAECGIRAIWVAPFMRRKRIASQLLDIVRKNFCEGSSLQPSQLAFSDPTSTGRALATNYCGTAAFLVYKIEL